MSRRDTVQRVRLLLSVHLCGSGQQPTSFAARIHDDAEFRRDLGADSLDLAEIPLLIEEEFGIRFTDEEVAFCETVGTAIDLIETKMENRPCGAGPGGSVSKNRRAA